METKTTRAHSIYDWMNEPTTNQPLETINSPFEVNNTPAWFEKVVSSVNEKGELWSALKTSLFLPVLPVILCVYTHIQGYALAEYYFWLMVICLSITYPFFLLWMVCEIKSEKLLLNVRQKWLVSLASESERRQHLSGMLSNNVLRDKLASKIFAPLAEFTLDTRDWQTARVKSDITQKEWRLMEKLKNRWELPTYTVVEQRRGKKLKSCVRAELSIDGVIIRRHFYISKKKRGQG